MFHNYSFYKEDRETLLFNSCFVDDEDIQYAYNHKFDVIYTETKCSNIFDIITKFIDLGYTLEIMKNPQYAPDGTKLSPLLYAKFVLHSEQKELPYDPLLLYHKVNYYDTREAFFKDVEDDEFLCGAYVKFKGDPFTYILDENNKLVKLALLR